MQLGALAMQDFERSDYEGGVFRVLFHVIRTAEQPNGLINKTQRELAVAVGISQASVCRALAVLQRDGHIYKKGRYLYVNPQTAFSGTGEQHGRAVAGTPDEVRSLTGGQTGRTEQRKRAKRKARFAVVEGGESGAAG